MLEEENRAKEGMDLLESTTRRMRRKCVLDIDRK